LLQPGIGKHAFAMWPSTYGEIRAGGRLSAQQHWQQQNQHRRKQEQQQQQSLLLRSTFFLSTVTRPRLCTAGEENQKGHTYFCCNNVSNSEGLVRVTCEAFLEMDVRVFGSLFTN